MSAILNYDDHDGKLLVKISTLSWLKTLTFFAPSKSRDTLDFRTLLAPEA